MSSFVNAIKNQTARTANNMKALKSTTNPCVDLFYNIGASRGQNIIPAFISAFVQNPDLATRIALWVRDARGGAGERKLFRDILTYLSEHDAIRAVRVLNRVPELGRWDDLFATKGDVRNHAFNMISRVLMRDNNDSNIGLVAKWMPRKGPEAAELRNFLGLTPKRYRKLLVERTKVVETQMCAKHWDEINYNHVPSIAAARYQKAFNKHDPVRYVSWKEALKKNDGTAKVNAATLYPYDVLRSVKHGDRDVALAQWEALPNFLGEQNILALVDVSGSMTMGAIGGSIRPLDVAVSLGLYVADKLKGKFKDTFLTFSNRPQLLHLQGNLLQKIDQMERSQWEMNTNLHAAFEKILETAVNGNVPPEEMPDTLLIFSDMQFDQCVRFDDSAIEMIRRKYRDHDYEVPKIVFWNLNASYGNVPVKYDERGAALVSGFSPSLMKSILGGEDFTPEAVMLRTIMSSRYDF